MSRCVPEETENDMEQGDVLIQEKRSPVLPIFCQELEINE